jgi:hypothetical protein
MIRESGADGNAHSLGIDTGSEEASTWTSSKLHSLALLSSAQLMSSKCFCRQSLQARDIRDLSRAGTNRENNALSCLAITCSAKLRYSECSRSDDGDTSRT